MEATKDVMRHAVTTAARKLRQDEDRESGEQQASPVRWHGS